MTTKDLTMAQAKRWVEQELPKAKTPAQVEARIKTETLMLGMPEHFRARYPNSMWAHGELIRRLKERLT